MEDQADPVFATVKRNVLVVLPDLHPDLVSRERSLRDLGCNSIDRADVVMLTMEALGVSVPVGEFAEISDIGTLVDMLRGHL